MSNKIFLDAPNVGKCERKYINKALATGYVSTVGPFVSQFEEKFVAYIGGKKGVSTQSGTSALHVALYELGIGKDDEVIVPALTFVATVNPIIYVGAKPVFVDVDAKTWNISPQEIRKKITKKTKAIIPVHLYGNPCEMDTIINLAKENGLYVIEDATESLGARYNDRYTGTFGDLGCFSFNGNKVITTGGGGMVVGSDERRLDHIKFLVNQGRDESREYHYPEIGFNYRMTNIEAALGLAQIERLDSFLEKKMNFNNIYKEELKGIRFINFQQEYDGASSSWWLPCIIFKNKVDIVSLQKKLNEKKIPTRRVFMPVTRLPLYKKYKKTVYKNAEHIYERGLCLPGSTLNNKKDIHCICKTLKNLI
ncbi:MAG: aminotransferase class V-fold PLP-dependent enzyme [Candidatus Omnitrophota bacterium]